MKFLDTGLNAQESLETLRLQQERLVKGYRSVQMFPVGTVELAKPPGIRRTENTRGVFHYNPRLISEEKLLDLSADGRENEFLELGPYSKSDVYVKLLLGETLLAVSEYTKSGVEVRTAVGTASTVEEQVEYFKATKQPGNRIVAGQLPDRAKHKEFKNG
jgi:hypothetical protein